ncbi:ABC transporter ATP-binding protein [Tenacibaculum dicentrarchi]|nr:ABC transporter ATP-binding protein [Tenacibaculum dicentrarchi]
MEVLEIKDLHKSFGNKKVLKGINISLESHEIHGIIGSNGAGKSTFFECICGLTKYEVEVSSVLSPLKDYIAYLPTTPYFFPRITGREYLTFLLKLSEKKNVNFEELANIFSLPLNSYVENYSTGMRKKISFVGLLLLEKSIYILDEPFNGVDLEGVELFKIFINKLKEKGCTVLVSSHIVDTLTDMCSDIHYLKDGFFIKKYKPENFCEIKKDLSSYFEEKASVFFQ